MNNQAPKGSLPVLERTVGCWSCTAWSQDGAKALWESRRVADLTIIAGMAIEHGENSERVKDYKRMVMSVDHQVFTGQLGTCAKRDLPRDKPIGDFTQPGLLCEHWSGRQGSSIARAGAALDKTSAEVFEDHLADVEKTRD